MWVIKYIIPILLFTSIIIFDYLETKQKRKLKYLLVIVYFFGGMPLLESIEVSKYIEVLFAIVGCVFTFWLCFVDIKKKQLQSKQ